MNKITVLFKDFDMKTPKVAREYVEGSMLTCMYVARYKLSMLEALHVLAEDFDNCAMGTKISTPEDVSKLAKHLKEHYDCPVHTIVVDQAIIGKNDIPDVVKEMRKHGIHWILVAPLTIGGEANPLMSFADAYQIDVKSKHFMRMKDRDVKGYGKC